MIRLLKDIFAASMLINKNVCYYRIILSKEKNLKNDNKCDIYYSLQVLKIAQIYTTNKIISRSNLKTKDEANLKLAFGNLMYDLEHYSDVSNSVESYQFEIYRFITYEFRE